MPNVEHYDIPAGLLRQRRNLFMVCVLISILALGNVHISEIDIFQVKADIINEKVIYISLWVLLGYWSIRYMQYFTEIASKGVRDVFRQKLDQNVWWWLRRKAQRVYTDFEPGSGVNAFSTFRAINPGEWEGEVFFPYKEGDREQKKAPLRVRREEIRWHIARAAIYTVAMRPQIFDYFFPFIMIAATLAIGLLVKWPGGPRGW